MIEETLSILTGLLLLLSALLLAFGALFYTMTSGALYILSVRRSLKHPYWAWFPGLRNWFLGALSDQYLYLTRGKRQNRRMPVLILSLVKNLFWLLILSLLPELFHQNITLSGLLGRLGLFLVVPLVTWGMKLPIRYRVFRSCCPRNAALYTTLSLLVPGAESALLLWCCRLDEGMPPRRVLETETSANGSAPTDVPADVPEMAKTFIKTQPDPTTT